MRGILPSFQVTEISRRLKVHDPEPGDRGTDTFFGFSLGSGVAINRLIFDLAYTFRTGTVHSEATNTAVFQHGLLASVIYHF